MFNFILELLKRLKPLTEKEQRDLYLGEATDMIDLERRMREWDNKGSRYPL